MARNIYDAPSRKGRNTLMLGVVGVAAVVIVGGVVWALGQQQAAAAEDWTPRGEPCPVWTGEIPASRSRPDLLSFDYGGARLGRWFGHAQCVELHEGPLPGGGVYHACHFTGPDFVRVELGGQTTIYRPGVGQPAIVTLSKGQARCDTDPRGVAPREP